MVNTTASAKTILFVIYEFEAALLTARDIYLYGSGERRSRSRGFKFIVADCISRISRAFIERKMSRAISFVGLDCEAEKSLAPPS